MRDERIERTDVVTTEDMYEAVMRLLPECDVVIKAAAPCDFKAAKTATDKIKATAGITLALEKTVDIAEAVGRAKGNKKLVVFAAETSLTEERAAEKRIKKHADMVVANDVTAIGAGFGTDTNIATLITERGTERLPLMLKSELADVILDRITEL